MESHLKEKEMYTPWKLGYPTEGQLRWNSGRIEKLWLN
jgi:hypothetical protein